MLTDIEYHAMLSTAIIYVFSTRKDSKIKTQEGFNMKQRKLVKGLFATAALALTIMATSASIIKADETPGTYTVERGDCLYTIAKKVYGNGNYWNVIYEANSGTIKNNHIIYKNQVLTIPAIDGVQNLSVPAVTTPAPAETAPVETAPAPTETATTQGKEPIYDYDTIASWVDSGYIGVNGNNYLAVMAVDANNEYALIITADDSDMTAFTTMGPLFYENNHYILEDAGGNMALDFFINEVNETTRELEMGNVGTAVVTLATKEEVLDTIKTAIQDYTRTFGYGKEFK